LPSFIFRLVCTTLCLQALVALPSNTARAETRGAEQTVSYAELVHRLTDLESLALLPPNGEQCAQWSSFHRDSRYDAATGKYVAWDQNGDQTGAIRSEGDQLVLAEMDGPGCIVRIWSASPQDGHVKIYLDGAETPAVDLPFRDYFSRSVAPFDLEQLVYKAAAGYNNFVPIPYQKSCRIVADKGWGAFYHFTYRTFPAGTRIPTFRRDLAPEDHQALVRVNQLLATQLGQDPAGQRPGSQTVSKTLELPARETLEAARLTGPRAITGLRVQLPEAYTVEEAARVLRAVVLKIRWDDDASPAVWVPLGDFFGTAPGVNYYHSLPLGMTPEGFYSYWYMPFASSAVLELANEDTRPIAVKLTIDHAPLVRPVEDYARFHAKWHRDAFLPAEAERAIDWTLLDTRGRGRFCGVMLHVWNPKGDWWGEGDEKFFVDGEKFPSTFGTGSEDYFGYAWSFAELFERAFHAQTFNRFDNFGHISVNRWQIMDHVPFQSSFAGYLEKYFSNDRPTNYACTSYWYLDSGGSDPYEPVPLAERVGYYDYILPSVGRDQAKFSMNVLHVAEKSGGLVSWSDGVRGPRGRAKRFLEWSGASVGERLVIELPALKEGGRFTPKLTLLRGPQFGRVQLYLDGEKLGGPMDLGEQALSVMEPLSFPARDLADGPHRLQIEMLSALPGGSRFGIDSLQLDGNAATAAGDR
jgi:hypothetical protein